jgi:hypothetical protein
VEVDETGMYGLRYAEFVVPLVKAVQELSEQNERLQAQLNELTELVLRGKELESSTLIGGHAAGSATGLQDVASNGASLQQNSPNPFHTETTIAYELPEKYSSANLYIYSSSGAQVKNYILNSSANKVTVSAYELAAGTYVYTLAVDGKWVDTKRMILTN